MPDMKPETVQFSIRLPIGLKETIQAIAAHEHRAMNQQISWMLLEGARQWVSQHPDVEL